MYAAASTGTSSTTEFLSFTITTLPGNFPGMEADVPGCFPASMILVAGFDTVLSWFDEIAERVEYHGLKTKVIGVTVTESTSIADKLYGQYFLDLEKLNQNGFLESKRGKRHFIYKVSDKDIFDALVFLRNLQSAEPSGAAGFAFLKYLKDLYPEFNPATNSVVVVNTGNGFMNLGKVPF